MRNRKISDHDKRDQDREGDADLHDERHAFGAGGGKHQSILKRHEADDLTDGVAARHHHQQTKKNDGEREGEILARQRIGFLSHAQHDHHGKRHQRHAGEHGESDADHLLDLTMNTEPNDNAVERDWYDRRLEDQGNARLNERLPGD